MTRGHIEFVHADDVAPAAFTATGWPAGADLKLLSQDTASGALTGVLVLPAGYRRGAGHLRADCELFVLAGSVRIGDTLRGFGYYAHAAAGVTHDSWVVEERCELLFMARTGAPEFVAGRGPSKASILEIDTERVDWEGVTPPGQPSGQAIKVLRHVPETGEFTALVGVVPAYTQPKVEFHDFIQENYVVRGDGWLGNSGYMRPGTYAWRPPWISHGPFHTHGGTMIFFWNEAFPHHWYVDDPWQQPELNQEIARRVEPV